MTPSFSKIKTPVFKFPFQTYSTLETTDISHKTRLVTKNRLLEFYADLHELQDIDHRLFRCHRAFIVNLANVVSINKTEKIVTFNHGESCLVSRRLLKRTIEQMNHLEKNSAPFFDSLNEQSAVP